MSFPHPIRRAKALLQQLFTALASIATAINSQSDRARVASNLLSDQIEGLKNELTALRAALDAHANAIQGEAVNVRNRLEANHHISTKIHNHIIGDAVVSARIPPTRNAY